MVLPDPVEEVFEDTGRGPPDAESLHLISIDRNQETVDLLLAGFKSIRLQESMEGKRKELGHFPVGPKGRCGRKRSDEGGHQVVAAEGKGVVQAAERDCFLGEDPDFLLGLP
jgi:hypothetical protein